MAASEQDDHQRLNEPRLLESEGYLVRALRRLGEGLAPYVFEKTQDPELLNKDGSWNRDIQPILRIMVTRDNWDRHFGGLGRNSRNWVSELIEFRNVQWAHLVGYGDDDVLHYLGVILRLLRATSCDEQAQAVEEMYYQLGRLRHGQAEPKRQRDAEITGAQQGIDELLARMTLQQFSELRTKISQVMGQLGGGQSTIEPPHLASQSSAQAARQGVPADDYNAISQADKSPRHESGTVSRHPSQVRQEDGDVTDSDRLSRQGAEAMGKGDWFAAIGFYSAAIDLDPQNASLFLVRASAHLEMGENARAIEDWSHALHLDPGSARAHYGRGVAYADQWQYDLAIDDFSAALQLGTDDALVYRARGSAYSTRGNYDLAISDFSEALQRTSDDALTYFYRGWAYSWNGEVDRAIDDYSKSLELDPDNASAYENRGFEYVVKEEYDKAIDDFDKAIQTMASSSEWQSVEDLEQTRDEIVRLRDAAIEVRNGATEYDKHIEETPDDAAGWHLRGLYYVDIGNSARAIADINEAVRLAPNNAEIWTDRGWAHWKQGSDDQAYDDYSRAIELNPDVPKAYYYRAWVWRRRGDHGNANMDFSKAIALDPEYAEAYQHRGISYLEIGELDKAQDDFEMARLLGFEP